MCSLSFSDSLNESFGKRNSNPFVSRPNYVIQLMGQVRKPAIELNTLTSLSPRGLITQRTPRADEIKKGEEKKSFITKKGELTSHCRCRCSMGRSRRPRSSGRCPCSHGARPPYFTSETKNKTNLDNAAHTFLYTFSLYLLKMSNSNKNLTL